MAAPLGVRLSKRQWVAMVTRLDRPFPQIRGHQYSNNCHLTLTKCQNVYTLMYIH
jgi:hypothetical protein